MTSQKIVIGIIGGLGWLGTAITKAIIDDLSLNQASVIISSRHKTPTNLSSRVQFTKDNQELADKADLIILSVRPSDWTHIKIDVHGKPVISVMAGISASKIKNDINTQKVIRSLPNAAATIKQSYTPWYCESSSSKNTFSENELTLIKTILASFGDEDRCQSEDEIDYLTAVSGAGPAYPALLSQALEESAISHGISPRIARRAANAVIKGSGHLLVDIDSSSKETLVLFEEYQGTTAAGLKKMKADGFFNTIHAGVLAAYRRSIELKS